MLTDPVSMSATTSSDRSFGWTFAGALALLGGWNAYKGGGASVPLLVVALALAALATVAPRWLAPLRRAWMVLGSVLRRLSSPVVLAVVYFVVLTPFAVIVRRLRRDPLCRRWEPRLPSYWMPRATPESRSEPMRDPF